MTLEQALSVVCGDRLIAAFNINYHIHGGDECHFMFWNTKDLKDTRGKVWHLNDKKLYEVNIQDFRMKEE